MRVFAAACAAGLAIAAPALANDSTAQLGAGGIELVPNDKIDLVSEDLYISVDRVKVTYHFRNHTFQPASYVVAFPLPAIDASEPDLNVVLPDPADPNFVDFRVTVDGQPVDAAMDEHATALGIDRTAELKRRNLPLNPMAEGLFDTLEKLPADERDALNKLGLLYVDEYNTSAAWTYNATFYWQQTFPPGKDVVIEHEYKPVVGFGFFGDWVLTDAGYRASYCIDDAFARAARAQLATVAKTDYPYLDEKRVQYILTTANNWSGTIGKFRLVVDKGSSDALVSFCGTGVKKISPTQFEMTATNFAPDKDLNILFAVPRKDQ